MENTSRKTSTEAPSAPIKRTQAEQASSSAGSAVASRDVKRQRRDTAIDGRRLLMVDLGHSTIPSLSDNHDTISWETLAETQQEQRAGVVLITGAPKGIGSDEIRSLFPGWESATITTNGSAIAVVWNPNHWHAEGFTKEILTKNPVVRAALCLKLRRATARSGAVEDHFVLLLTKFHRGTAQSGQSFQAHDRATAWESMLNILRRETASKWMITGSLATQEVQLAVNIKATGSELDPTRVFSADKAIACVAQGIDLASCQNHDKKQVLVIEIDRGEPSSASCQNQDLVTEEPDSAKEGEQNHHEAQRNKLQLTAFSDCFVKALRNAKDDAFEHLVPLLYGPRLPYKWAEDGTLLLTAPTQKQCEQKLEFALKLIHEARYQAQKGGALTARPGPADDCRKLGDEEMKKGLAWLKCRYREDYITRPGLAEALASWDSGDYEFDGPAKTKMRNDFRSGFRTFLRDSIGDASIAIAILRNGYSTPEALMALVREIFDAREKAKAERERKPSAVTRRSHPDIAAAAKKARQQFATGKRLADGIEGGTMRHDTLKEWEKDLHQQFHTGQLKRQMINANRNFGHGVGVDQSLSIEPA